MSVKIVPSNHTRIGAWVNSKMSIGDRSTVNSMLYNTINCHVRISYKHRRHGKLACVTIQFVTLHLGSDACH